MSKNIVKGLLLWVLNNVLLLASNLVLTKKVMLDPPMENIIILIITVLLWFITGNMLAVLFELRKERTGTGEKCRHDGKSDSRISRYGKDC